MEEWQHKQEYFLDFLQTHNADSSPYRVDLDKKKIYWVNDEGNSLVVADCRVLLSYALSNNSVMMAWVNSSLAEGSAIEEVEEMKDIYPDCEPEDVWEIAMRAGTAAGAEAIYRTPSPQAWVMLGLWNLRPGSGEEQFETGSPRSHVLQVVQSLLNYPDYRERQVLIDNYAESFLQMASHPYKNTTYADELRDTARLLRNLLVFDEAEVQDKALIEVQARWAMIPD